MVLPVPMMAMANACGGTTKSVARPTADQVLEQALSSETATPRPPVTGALPPEPPSVPLALRVVARSRNGRIRLHAVSGQDLVVQAGSNLATVRGGALHLETTPAGSYEGDVVRLAGKWPEDGWMVVSIPSLTERTTAFRSYRWQGGVIKRAPSDAEEFYADVTPWTGGQPLALVGGVHTGTATPPKGRFETVGKIPARVRGALDPGFCWERSASLASGEVYALGKSCAASSPRTVGAKLALARWTAGEAKAALDVLPGVDWDTVFDLDVGPVIAHAPNDLYASATYKRATEQAKPYLAHYDGAEWKVIPVPAGKPALTSVVLAPNGSLWVTVTDGVSSPRAIDREGELWERSAAGRWKQARLPNPPGALNAPERWVFRGVDGKYRRAQDPPARAYMPTEVHVGRAGELWVSAVLPEGDDEAWVLLSSVPASVSAPPKVLEFPDTTRKTPPARDACATYFVSMGPLAASAPFDTTFPGIRKAFTGQNDLEGIELLETTFGGRRIVGVFSVNGVLAGKAAKILSKLISAHTTLQPECRAPIATRVIPFKIQTGETTD